MSFNDSTNSQHMNHLRTVALYKSSNEFTRGHVFYDMNEKRIVCLFFFLLVSRVQDEWAPGGLPTKIHT